MNNTLKEIISNNFITGFRAIDSCRIKNKVVKIRSINNNKYDILTENFENVYYDESISNGKVIPYIYGNINSYIKFPDIIKSNKYTICCISKYNGNTSNKIITIQNLNDKISSIGHSNGWAGIIEFVNSSSNTFKKTNKNYNDNWIVSCLSYNGDLNDGYGDIYIGSYYDNNDIVDYFHINNISPAIIGNLTINRPELPYLNSDWALSHLLVWNNSMSSFDLKTIYNNMINYLRNPTSNDLILFNEYPRNFPNCIEQFYNINTEMNSETNSISVKLPWAGYYAGNYDSKNNILPNFIDVNDRTKDIKTVNINNVKLDNTDKKLSFLYGDKDSYIIFPDNSIGSNFTICSITKYTSKNPDNNKKILRSIDNKTQFYHGHYNNKIGVIEYDNYEFSKGITITADNPTDSWIAVCAKNSKSPNNVYINNNDLSLTNIDNSYFSINRNPNILTINYNKDMSNTDNSEWALAYILIWDSHLTADEMKSVSNSLNTYINTGIIPKFSSLNTIEPKDLTKKEIKKPINIDKYQYLDLTDIQKKMLL